MELNIEDVLHIKELHHKYDKGQRISSQELTDLYNKVTNKKVNNTTCGSCLRQMLFELVRYTESIKDKYKLQEDEIEFLKWTKTLPEEHFPSFEKVCSIYNRVFNTDRQINSCLPCLKSMLNCLYILM